MTRVCQQALETHTTQETKLSYMAEYLISLLILLVSNVAFTTTCCFGLVWSVVTNVWITALCSNDRPIDVGLCLVKDARRVREFIIASVEHLPKVQVRVWVRVLRMCIRDASVAGEEA